MVNEQVTLAVGQRVWIYDVNDRYGNGPVEGTVSKIGRKLVTVQSGKYRTESVFRLDDQHANDGFRHRWFRTDEQREAHDRRQVAEDALKKAGVQVWQAKLTTEQVEAIAQIVRGPEGE